MILLMYKIVFQGVKGRPPLLHWTLSVKTRNPKAIALHHSKVSPISVLPALAI